MRQHLNEALKAALKDRDQRAVSTLRLILAALKDRDIAARGRGNTDGLGDEEILGLLQTMIRQRRESIELYEQGCRLDLAEREQEEIDVIRRFLPPQLDEAQTRAAVDQVIQDTGATCIKDVGRCMKTLKDRYAGRMDFGKAGGMVRGSLA